MLDQESKSSNSKGIDELTKNERDRIRAEMRYAHLVAQEARPQTPPKTIIEKFLGFLSNGFILLIVGSLITSVLVPEFQRSYDQRKQQLSLMQDCLTQFLTYSNSIWSEYYTVLPLTQKLEIEQDEYLEYIKKISEIKLKRYNAFAKVIALSVVFEGNNDSVSTGISKALKQYAINLNSASTQIDRWLTGLYCTPTERALSPCASYDPDFDAYHEHLKIKQTVVNLGNTGADNVAAMIVNQINHL